jgi:hypothetical protein
MKMMFGRWVGPDTSAAQAAGAANKSDMVAVRVRIMVIFLL